MFSVSEREPGDGPGEWPERDPVNHRPPEEWRPGDPGDPMGDDGRPPGEPPHRPPPRSGSQRSGGSGELSEGPNGPGWAGPEGAGYAPGYGDYPSTPVDYGNAGGYVPGTGPPPVRPTPWGRILGIGCGVLLLVLLLLGGCATVLLFTAGADVSPAPEPSDDGRVEALVP